MAFRSAPDDKNFPTLNVGLKRYLASGEGSDLKIKCRSNTIDVHRIIVCAQSPFFTNALKEEHNFKEAQTSTVELNDDDPDTVKAAIQFMYMGYYFDNPPSGDYSDSGLADFHLSVYFLADKIGIGGLREYCAKEIEKLFPVHNFSPELFLHVVCSAYNNIPGDDDILHHSLVSIATKSKILPLLTKQIDFLEIFEAAGRFGAAVLKTLAGTGKIVSGFNGLSQYQCDSCRQNVAMVLSMNTEPNGNDLEPSGDYPMDGSNTFCPSCGRVQSNEEWKYNRM